MTDRDDTVRELADAARDAAVTYVRFHEDDVHDGEPCGIERLNLIAFVAHSIGVTVKTLSDPNAARKLVEILVGYEESHDATNPCPVCGCTLERAVEYERVGDGDEARFDRCRECGWPPNVPYTIEEWRAIHEASS